MKWNVGFLLGFFTLCVSAQAGKVSSTPRRIISLSPNLTEIVYDIGAQDLLVGDTDFCKFPPEARKKEKIGGWINPNFEKIVSLKPDIVLTLKFHVKIIETLKRLKIPVLIVDCDTVDEILGSYDHLGRVLGHENQAKIAKKALKRRLTRIQDKVKGKKPVSVLFVIGRTPGTLEQIYGVGKKNFVNELIHLAGGINVVEDAMTDYPLVSKEQLIQRDPDVIVDSARSHGISNHELNEKVDLWKRMPVLKAVQKDQVYYFKNEDFLIPGPTMVNLAEYLCDIFEKVRSKRK
jgi:iron complex transport system substrate-binding protein